MKAHPKIVGRLLEAIRASQSLCVVSHVRPDGDGIGSQLGLTMVLKNLGKDVVCWNADGVPNKLQFLDKERLVRPPEPGRTFDCVISVDAASTERLGPAFDCVQDRTVFLNIDHHPSNTRFADINWVSSREPSTGELIFRLIKAAGWAMTPAIADCLFTAVSTDTGSFQYPSTRPSTYAVAGELVKRGANLANICNEVYQSYPLSRVRLLQRVLNHFKLTDHNRIAYFWLRPGDFSRTGAEAGDSEGLIDHLRAIEPVVVACLFEEVESGLVRISLRSKSEAVDVNAIACQFQGGGHRAAAGARISGRPLSVQRRVLAALKKALNSAR